MLQSEWSKLLPLHLEVLRELVRRALFLLGQCLHEFTQLYLLFGLALLDVWQSKPVSFESTSMVWEDVERIPRGSEPIGARRLPHASSVAILLVHALLVIEHA